MSEEMHTNRLIHEKSPYLQQHAHNPVDWFPWGKEALEKAKADDKPILVSIGYAACHWCHVMEHESFEDAETAKIMNEHFVNIKVDREERPDLDEIYMNAVQLLRGQGGWPLNCFLTPDLHPFYGGTYFPPRAGLGMPSFKQILLAISKRYKDENQKITIAARGVTTEIEKMSQFESFEKEPTEKILDAAFHVIAGQFDSMKGGFGGAPKFPQSLILDFLIRHYDRTQKKEALDMVTFTLKKMLKGGIHDLLGGGFHRYSTDAMWLVPHFEKMLYDNALLAGTYVEAYQVSGNELFLEVAKGIGDYVLREMTSPEGGFYASQDADSEGVEGKFFVWDLKEIKELLGEDDAPFVCDYFDVTEAGNFEGQNILHLTKDLESVAKAHGLSASDAKAKFEEATAILFKVREKRIKPDRDEKVLASWNGLMIYAFAKLFAVTRDVRYKHAAEGAAAFISVAIFTHSSRPHSLPSFNRFSALVEFAEGTAPSKELFIRAIKRSWSCGVK